jgi:hypothetical protein
MMLAIAHTTPFFRLRSRAHPARFQWQPPTIVNVTAKVAKSARAAAAPSPRAFKAGAYYTPCVAALHCFELRWGG